MTRRDKIKETNELGEIDTEAKANKETKKTETDVIQQSNEIRRSKQMKQKIKKER